jgi:hypothetical protein
MAAALHVLQTDAKASDWGSWRRCRIRRSISVGRSDQPGFEQVPAQQILGSLVFF